MNRIYGASSAADEVLDGINLTGKRVLITGVSAGLGVETARALAARGATVIGTARDIAKAEAAISTIRSSGGVIELIDLDLANLESVRASADKLLASAQPFDIIIANAGVMATPEGRTVDGFETQFGTNVIGHFVFINRITSLLHASSRIVFLSSAAHAISDVDLDDINFEKTPYDPWVAYGRSKTAVAQLAVEFERRFSSKDIHAVAVHPGAIQTELQRHYSKDVDEAFIKQINEANAKQGLPPFQWKSIPQGAATSVWAGVVAPVATVGGLYCEDCHLADVNDSEGVTNGVRSYALDTRKAQALWEKLQELVKETF